MARIRILYFAWLRDRLQRAGEEVTLPAGVGDIAGLRAWMGQRGAPFASVFAEGASIRAAVNQDFAPDSTVLRDGDEVALFPPVTGG